MHARPARESEVGVTDPDAVGLNHLDCIRSKPVLTGYGSVLAILSVGALLPNESVQHACIAVWTFAAMPSSVLLAVPFMGVNVLVGNSTVASAVVGFGFHVLASAVNVAGIAAVHHYATRNRRRPG